MDQDSAGHRTRSGRNFSGGSLKRKRSIEYAKDTTAPSNKKMAGGNDISDSDTNEPPSTYDKIRTYLSTTHRAEVQADTNKAVDKISARLDATQDELARHKAKMDRELGMIKDSISRIEGQPNPGTSYAAAAGVSALAMPSASPRAMDLQSQETRTYWQFRKCAKVHPVEGETIGSARKTRTFYKCQFSPLIWQKSHKNYKIK